MSQAEQSELARLTVELLSAYVANNTVASGDLAGLIEATRAALAGEKQTGSEQAPEFVAAVSVEASLASRDHIVSLIDGKAYRALKRHLSSNGLTPEEYKTRYGLPADYPLVAPSYSEQRSKVAKKMGLGGSAAKTTAPSSTPTNASADAPGQAAEAVVAKKRAAKAATAKAKTPKAAKAPAKVPAKTPVAQAKDLGPIGVVSAGETKPARKTARTKSVTPVAAASNGPAATGVTVATAKAAKPAGAPQTDAKAKVAGKKRAPGKAPSKVPAAKSKVASVKAKPAEKPEAAAPSAPVGKADAQVSMSASSAPAAKPVRTTARPKSGAASAAKSDAPAPKAGFETTGKERKKLGLRFVSRALEGEAQTSVAAAPKAAGKAVSRPQAPAAKAPAADQVPGQDGKALAVPANGDLPVGADS